MRSEDSGRYLSLAPDLVTHRGYLTTQTPDTWGLLANQRGMLFGLEDIQGYSSIQLPRYWRFVRASSPIEIDYNAAVFASPPPVALDLLQVRWVVGRQEAPPLGGLTRVTDEGSWSLYERNETPPRASVLSTWQVVSSPDQALQTVLAPGFDPRAAVILEQDPRLTPSPVPSQPGTATYQALGTQAARVEVNTPVQSVVLVRNVYDKGWHATVDGHPAPVLPADYLIQGIPVPAGHHVIFLRFDDPSIGYGLAGSTIAIAVLLGTAAFLRRREPGLRVPI
jgi:hypothetical protein